MPSKTFAYTYQRWTLAEFERYIATVPLAQLMWATGITIHHSYIPTLAQWKATGSDLRRMDGLARYYQYDVDNGAGWPSGPHLFISDERIMQLTPITQPGTHGRACNPHFIGIEVIGDYDRVAWSANTEALVLGACSVLMHKRKLKVTTKNIIGHRDCPSTKSCPGDAISLDVVRRNLLRTMNVTPKPPVPKVDGETTVIGVVKQSATYAQCRKYLLDNGVTASMLSEPEMDRIWQMAGWLGIDFAFFIAVWKQESFVDDPNDDQPNRPIIGGGTLQKQTHMPLNMRAANGEWRFHVNYVGSDWLGYSTWQVGCMGALVHLKSEYGDIRGLRTLEDIIDVLAPAKDGNDTATYKDNVKTRMANMAALPLT